MDDLRASSPLSPPAIQRAVSSWLDANPQAPVKAAPVKAKRRHGPMHISLAAMGAGQAADVFSTVSALKRPGTRESNPIYGDHPSLAKIAGIKAAGMIPTAYMLDKMYDKHPKIAMSLAIGLGALGGGMAIRNSKQGKR